jgi:ligand-binding sensor domain-containing protein
MKRLSSIGTERALNAAPFRSIFDGISRLFSVGDRRPTFWSKAASTACPSLPNACYLAISFALVPFVMLSAVSKAAQANQSSSTGAAVPQVRVEHRRITLPLLDGMDIRFTHLPKGLSQTRVAQIVQDNQGFMWFGTQNGLNRYDGYKFKVFRHDPEDPDSLSGVYIYSLFKDRSGAIWVGTDQLLDRYDPVTEKFRHYRFDAQDSKGLTTTVNHISQDSSGMLWLSTGNGLFRLDPATGRTAHFRHVPNDPSSFTDNDVKSTGEDRAGTFWVATTHSLDVFDRVTCKVVKRVPLPDSGMGAWFHEDRSGLFWLIHSADGLLATFDRKANTLTTYSFSREGRAGISKFPTYAMLEDSEGTMWFATGGAGLLKFDRVHRRFVSYNNHPGDTDSLADTRVNTLLEDREGNIWLGLHQVEPSFFAKKPQMFQKFTYRPGNPASLGSSLVTVLYEDKQGILWAGADRSLKRIDRRTGQYSTFEQMSGGEVLSIVPGGVDTLWFGTAHQGVVLYNRRTGRIKAYPHTPADPSTVSSETVERLLVDHKGTLWAATWDGLSRFDPSSERFTTYRQNPTAHGLNYYAIAEDRHGGLWLGGNLGLQHFETDTGKFTSYVHELDDSKSLSDNRVNSVFLDHTGAMWVGTQNGLDEFAPQTGTFTRYAERDGMAGNVISCIQEDQRGRLWMSTNQGVSSFDPLTKRFNNYTAADGLPGDDLTGWGACFKSAAGEMFFGGFSGATAFYPDKVVDSLYVPPVVLTDFRLFGASVAVGSGSPLKKSITYANALILAHRQNMLSLEFSALSYSNPATNRYRYKLEPLYSEWHEVGSDERVATYTTLPAGDYSFRVQGATSRGTWSEPGASVRIEILPPFWGTWWFLSACGIFVFFSLWLSYRIRLRQISWKFNMRLEERLAERTRIARELHDTLLQSFQALMFNFQAVDDLLPPGKVKEALEKVLDRADQAISEGRNAIQNIRSTAVTNELSRAVIALAEDLTTSSGENIPAAFRVSVDGIPRDIRPILRDDIYRIAREALRNAFLHARASQIEADITYGESLLRLRFRDDGKGIDPEHLHAGRDGHWGLPGMRERAREIGAQLDIWSEIGAGTEVELRIPGSIAYERAQRREALHLFRKKTRESNER